MLVTFGCGERIHGCDLGVIAHDGSDRVECYAFSVSSPTVAEQQAVLADVTCQAVAEEPLDKGAEFYVPACNLIHEIEPYRAFGGFGWRYRSRPSDVVLLLRW